LLDEFWNSSAFKNLDFEVDIRVKWDWFTTYWRPGKSITIHIERWAVESGDISLMELS